LKAQQVIFPHDPHHPFVVYLHSSSVQLRGDSPIAVAAAMLQGDLLDRRLHFHLFLNRLLFLQRPVKAPAADRHHLTHALDTQAALP